MHHFEKGSSPHPRLAVILCLVLLLGTAGWAQSEQDDKSGKNADPSAFWEGRIVEPEQIAAAMRPKGSTPWLVLGWPFGKLISGMEKGLIAFEEHKIQQKIFDFQQKLGRAGFRPLFGGLGEGSGIGVGTVFQVPRGLQPKPEQTALQLLGRMSVLSGYQEFAANFLAAPVPESSLILLANYQWRPTEPYYGYGQHSSSSDISSFALRQTSFAARWEQTPIPRISFGGEYSISLLEALPSTRGPNPPIDEVFGDVPGLNEKVKLQSIGAYIGANGLRGEYGLGGLVDVGVSWQTSIGEGDVRYLSIDSRIEGRLPIAPRRSVLIGQAVSEMTREDMGGKSLPFYLYPRIGGSSTLRGFPLDRFYGRNMIFATLEYRIFLNPNMDFSIFYDEGQIYQNTDTLSFLDWHRTYGVGFRFNNATGTQLRMELASSSEGFSFHIIFGGRMPRPLGGPVRYPNYRP